MGFKGLKIIMGKIIFKKNSMMVILVLLVLSFAGCKQSENEIPEHERLTGLGSYEGLDPETELKIIKYYLGSNYSGQESIDYWKFEQYYGLYNDNVVFRVREPWSFGMFYTSEAGGLWFAGKIMIWHNDECYEIEDAFIKEILTMDDLEKIKELNEEFFPNIEFPPEHEYLTGLGTYEGLDPETELQIIKWYLNSHGNIYLGQESLDNWRFYKYYGVYNGSVVFTDNAYGLYKENVGGITFVGPIIVFNGNRGYHLNDAYKKGFLTIEDLEKIKELN